MKNNSFTRRCAFVGAVAVALIAGTAAAAKGSAAKRIFVLWDQWLKLPAICYPLDDGWQGLGKVYWNVRGDNKFLATTVLFSPEKHMIVQSIGPMAMASDILTPQRLAEFQNPKVLAQNLATEINSGIVVPGLSDFVATDGRFSQDVPPFTKALASMYRTGSGLTTVSAFSFEGTFTCMYGGVRCEAKYAASFAVSVSAVRNPKVPKICSWARVSPTLVVAPPGKMSEAIRDGGRMFASAFVNHAWLQRRDSTLNALVKGTLQGREEGFAIWKQSQADTSAMLDRVRQSRSEQIREVKTVDNPFEPGTKVERPAFFENSWLNSRQDMMLLSDSSLEPNTIRGLMEQGDWLPAN